MPEITQYSLSHREILEMIIKNAGIHSGKWMLAVNFGFSAVNIGSGPDDALPSAIVQVQKIYIQHATPDAPNSLVLDAAEVNPAPKGAAGGASRRKN